MFGIFTPKLGEDEPNLMSIFFKRVDTNHQPVKPELVRKIWTESSTISTLLGGNSKKWGINFHPDGDMIQFDELIFVKLVGSTNSTRQNL